MKKKCFAFGSVSLLIFFLSGCGKEEAIKTMVCESQATQGEVKMNLHYTVTYSGDYVKTVETKEVLTSDDEKTLNAYKTAVENVYKNYDDIDYYQYHVQLDGKTLTSTVSIDYDHVDTKKLISINQSEEQLIKNGKVKIDDIQSVYESVGATCKVKSEK